jgi:TPR repeat protein
MFYKRAKEHHRELADYSLAQLRAMCHLICNILSNDHEVRSINIKGLENKINDLYKARLINRKTNDKLHQLRRNGNVGAHPEKFFNTKSELVNLAIESLTISRDLLELSFQKLFPGNSMPAYEVSESTTDNLKQICYQAMIEADPEARHMSGMMLLGKAKELDAEARKLAESSGFAYLGYEYASIKSQALFWFKLAAESHYAPAMYEYGVALADGAEGDSMRGIGENYIFRACELGNADARAFIGDCLLHGTHSFEADPVEARKYLELAATDDQPSALTNLGALYEKGIGGEVNLRIAFDYTLRAAEAGYPLGQYNLAAFYFNGLGISVDEKLAIEWLTKSALQGCPIAMLHLGHQITIGKVQGKGTQDTEELYLKCISSPEYGNQARFHLSQLYISENNDKSDWNKLIIAANLLQECYERELGQGDLAQKCITVAQPLIRRLRKGFKSIAQSKTLLESVIIVLNYFNEYGYPVLNRKERDKELIGKFDKFDRAARQLSDSEKLKLSGKLFTPLGLPASASAFPAQRIAKIGRNQGCSCGSGKKFKVCCGK